MTKKINVLITVAIIVCHIFFWAQGNKPTWFMFFLGWIFVLLSDLHLLHKDN